MELGAAVVRFEKVGRKVGTLLFDGTNPQKS